MRDIILQAEETARAIAAKLPPAKPSEKSTFEERTAGLAVTGSYLLLDVMGPGKLREATVVATVPDFGIQIMKDGRMDQTETYSDLLAESQFVDAVAAYKEGSAYVVHFAELAFQKELRVIVNGTLTLTRTYVKYDLDNPS